MSHRYSHNYTPPAPALLVHLSLPGEVTTAGPYTAVIDTGTDGTLVPRAWLEALAPSAAYETQLRPAFGPSRRVTVYLVDVIVEGQRFPGINVVSWDEGREILLGRNVLNRLVLLLDGPGQTTDVLSQRPKAGRLLRENAEVLAGPA